MTFRLLRYILAVDAAVLFPHLSADDLNCNAWNYCIIPAAVVLKHVDCLFKFNTI